MTRCLSVPWPGSEERWLFSWIGDVWKLDEDTILRTAGLDAVVSTRWSIVARDAQDMAWCCIQELCMENNQ
jgi:hypothetical protein